MIDSILEDYSKYIKEEKKLSNNTIIAYLRDISCFNKYLKETSLKTIKDVNKTIIITYLIYLQKIGRTPSSISRNMSGIRCLFQFLLNKNYILVDPTLNLKVPKGERKSPKILSRQEVEILLSMPDTSTEKGCRDKSMLELLYATGMKVSEISSLNFQDIDFDLCKVDIENRDNLRKAPINKSCLKYTKEYLEKYRNNIKENEALFINKSGKRLTRQGLWKIIKTYGKKSQIGKNITPQVLRNSFAVHLLNKGGDIKSLQEILGHSDINTTSIYSANSYEEDAYN